MPHSVPHLRYTSGVSSSRPTYLSRYSGRPLSVPSVQTSSVTRDLVRKVNFITDRTPSARPRALSTTPHPGAIFESATSLEVTVQCCLISSYCIRPLCGHGIDTPECSPPGCDQLMRLPRPLPARPQKNKTKEIRYIVTRASTPRPRLGIVSLPPPSPHSPRSDIRLCLHASLPNTGSKPTFFADILFIETVPT
jgi:hypothetical protein